MAVAVEIAAHEVIECFTYSRLERLDQKHEYKNEEGVSRIGTYPQVVEESFCDGLDTEEVDREDDG